MENNNKYTVITGASSGIGWEAAKAFAKRNKNLILIARREERLKELQKELLNSNPNIDVIVKSADLSVAQNVYQIYDEIKPYVLETLVNNAGFGDYSSVAAQDLSKIESMLHLNIEALTILSSLFVRDYKDAEGAQLINISSRGGYIIVPNAVTYCATKFYVGAFTEGLAHELIADGAKLQAKLLAPAATKTEFGMVANNVSNYDYDNSFSKYHTGEQMASFLLELYDSKHTVGLIDWQSFEFTLKSPIFNYAGNSAHNQKL